jgi:glycosyltransferase involved in cell wall biosynthesis
VTHESPNVGLGGGGIRQAQLLRAVASELECDLFCAGEGPDASTAAGLRSIHQVEVPPPAPHGSLLARRLHDLRLAAWAGPSEVHDARAARAALGSALERQGPHDLVLVEHAGLEPLVSRRRAGEHWSLTLHNVASERARQQLATTVGRRQRFLVAREAAQAAALERRGLEAYDTVVAVSDTDAAALGPGCLVVPNGVDVEAFPFGPLVADPVVIFSGTLGYLPNLDGLRWLSAEVWPRVLAERPDARLLVVGRTPTPEIRTLTAHASISLHVDVPEVQPYLASARVSVVPLRVGSGTRLKALEAMSAGIPLVGTSTGLDGLGLVPDRDALVADEAPAFARGILRLLADDATGEALARSARRLVDEHFGWDRIGRDYVRALRERAGA